MGHSWPRAVYLWSSLTGFTGREDQRQKLTIRPSWRCQTFGFELVFRLRAIQVGCRLPLARDGDMKRGLLALSLACFLSCGCAGRIDADLLQARIRDQAAQLTESQRDVSKTRSELKRTRLEADRLKAELSQVVNGEESVPTFDAQISRVHIYALASGGLNTDEFPGDDAVVVQFVPLDNDNEPMKLAGQVEFALFDPRRPEPDRELGRWRFSADECRSHWTRGFTSSGFQFRLPFDQIPTHSELVIHLTYREADDRRHDVSQVVKIVVPTGNATSKARRAPLNPIQIDDSNDEFLPPVSSEFGHDDGFQDADSGRTESADESTKPGHTVLHSSNWTDSTIPRLR